MAGKERKSGFRTGYQKTSACINSAFNLLLAFVLIVVGIPLFIVLGVTILIRSGRPLIYKGTRLGKNRKPFVMYKFRTLVPEAEKLIGAQLFSSSQNLLTPTGKFLRDTRLDELPQLLNILKRDMDFVGPRPERPEIYEHICQYIPGYDKRFTVRPGLLGMSQVFTPHSTPKRIRAFIDNKLIDRKQQIFWDAYAIGFTMLAVLTTAIREGAKYLYNHVLREKILSRYNENRALERVAPRQSLVYLEEAEADCDPAYCGTLVDINEEAFLMNTDRPLLDEEQPIHFILKTEAQRRSANGRKWKRAVCVGRLYRKSKNKEGTYDYVFMFKPASPLNHYMVHQYFLHKSLAS